MRDAAAASGWRRQDTCLPARHLAVSRPARALTAASQRAQRAILLLLALRQQGFQSLDRLAQIPHQGIEGVDFFLDEILYLYAAHFRERFGQYGNFVKRKPPGLCPLDEADAIDDVLRITPMRPERFCRHGNETTALVIADGLYAHASLLCDTTDVQCITS